MTVKVNSNGDFAENCVSNADSPTEASVVGDLYDILQKSDHSIQSLAHETRKAYGIETGADSELAQWCNAVPSIKLIDETDDMDTTPNLGRLFYKATGYTASDYNSFEGKYDSELSVSPLGECGQEGELIKQILTENGIVDTKDTVHVPINSNGDFIPPIVASEEKQENMEIGISLPTFEQGMERLKVLLSDYIDEPIAVQETNEEPSDEPSDSDAESDHWLTDVQGIGNEVFAKVKSEVVENQRTLHHGEFADADEWRNSPVVVTKEEARDRLQNVALEMDSNDFSKAMKLIEQGNTNQAMMAVEQHE